MRRKSIGNFKAPNRVKNAPLTGVRTRHADVGPRQASEMVANAIRGLNEDVPITHVEVDPVKSSNMSRITALSPNLLTGVALSAVLLTSSVSPANAEVDWQRVGDVTGLFEPRNHSQPPVCAFPSNHLPSNLQVSPIHSSYPRSRSTLRVHPGSLASSTANAAQKAAGAVGSALEAAIDSARSNSSAAASPSYAPSARLSSADLEAVLAMELRERVKTMDDEQFFALLQRVCVCGR